jgi:small subunit ribosomal protein S16
MGKKRQPIYKIVAADSRAPRDGKFLENIGLYNPLTNPATLDLKEDRALYWLSVGAQPTATVKNLLSKKGVLLKRELVKQGLSEADVNSKMEAWSKQNEGKVAKIKVAVKAEVKAEEPVAEVKAEVKAEEPVAEVEPKIEEKTAEVLSTASEEKTAE